MLEYSSEPPSYCAFCGQALAETRVESTVGQQDHAVTSPVAPRPIFPERIGAYRLIRRVGSGGMGTVYEAQDESSGGHVAVKLLARDLASSSDALERFRREGRLASAIAHPRCVFVLTTDEEAGQPYIVMELMPGETLRDYVQQHGPLAASEAVRKILDVIDGLQEVHRCGVIHRDVKPSNCFLEADGRVKVGDFGLAQR
jgi:eukaryotic-like serine/threonine-protein kinase